MMTKRTFRKQPRTAPRYPTLERFDGDRREFLGNLGAGLLGVLALDGLVELGSKSKKPPKGKGKPKNKKSPKKKPKKKPPVKRPPQHMDGDVLGAPARIDEPL